jgi:hypothetical protein
MLINLLLLTPIALFYYAGLVKFAALLLRYKVSWKSSLLFAVIMLIIVLVTHRTFPAPLLVAIGEMVVFAAGLSAFGSWFFRKRITDATGHALGWDGSIRLSALALSIILLLGIALLVLTRETHFLPAAQP